MYMGINYTTTAQCYYCNLHRYVLLVAQSEAAPKKRSKFAVGKQQASYMPHKGLKSPKRFTNLPSDSSRCLGEKGRLCIKRKKKLGIQLEFCILYMFSLLHPGTHDLSQCQKKQATLCSDFRGGL